MRLLLKRDITWAGPHGCTQPQPASVAIIKKPDNDIWGFCSEGEYAFKDYKNIQISEQLSLVPILMTFIYISADLSLITKKYSIYRYMTF